MSSTILIADDEDSIVQLTKLYLTREGYRILTAHDGQEALETARRTFERVSSHATRVEIMRAVPLTDAPRLTCHALAGRLGHPHRTRSSCTEP